ncbi:hypothetical protein ABT158_48875 [Nonomuraea sp. NPDC001636]
MPEHLPSGIFSGDKTEGDEIPPDLGDRAGFRRSPTGLRPVVTAIIQ